MGIFNIFGVVKYRETITSEMAEGIAKQEAAKKAFEAYLKNNPVPQEGIPTAKSNSEYDGISQVAMGGNDNTNTTMRDNAIKAKNAAAVQQAREKFEQQQKQEQKQEQKLSHKPSKPQRCNTNPSCYL